MGEEFASVFRIQLQSETVNDVTGTGGREERKRARSEPIGIGRGGGNIFILACEGHYFVSSNFSHDLLVI
jgi:hypothetical protein